MNMETKNAEYKFIVGIGASAGGLEAMQELLGALPANTDFPYIIVQHLSPDYKSMLTQILSKCTEMPVKQAEDGTRVEANHVYIIQPGKMMTISGGCLHYTNQVPKELNLPIDAFFRSLAEDAGARAIAVVLSGTGSDGTSGIRAIKENDGFVIVQSPESSKFDGMPRSAVRTGLVDAQITPEEIAHEIKHIAGVADAVISQKVEQEANVELMKRVYAILKKASNVNFAHYKQITIVRRMERRMMLTHRNQLGEYVDFLAESPEEAKTLSKELLIGVTNFFRDPEMFHRLKETAITAIVKHSTPDEAIRAWVAGCSTGEEAYSIAMLFAEVMDELEIRRKVKIFATDLDAESVETAGRGVYGESIMNAVSPARLSRFFTRRNNTYIINRDIRKMIVFSPHNVFQDPPFGRLDLISCRNMLIYFQPVLQNDLFSIFHMSLNDGGYLFLGKSETIGPFAEAFPAIDSISKIYAHCRDVKISGAKRVPFLDTAFNDEEAERDLGMSFVRAAERAEVSDETAELNAALLEKYMPACIVVNEKNELVHSFGERGNYIHVPNGRFSNNLFDLLTEALKVPVSTLLREARGKQCEVQYTHIPIQGEREKTVIDLTVAPVSTRVKDDAGLYSVIFTEYGRLNKADESVPYDIDMVASQRITDLEQENAAIQSKLDRSIAEQECVNEELQAANEELLTANEELQSSNEELQSVNEELYTVNTEYQMKMQELNETSDDLANFLSSTLTGIIFVDSKLNIRRYTDYVTSEFSVMDHDIGRSLAFISYHFPTIDITEICTEVLKTLIPDEREIKTVKGRFFFMRVAPYRSAENKIMGCVITLMDITSQKQGQATLLNTEKRLSMAQSASDAKSDYLTRVAREIQTPMNSLIMLSKKAMESAGDKQTVTENLRRITDMVEFMAAIVTNITEASISEQMTGEQVMTPFSLRLIFDNIAVMMSRRAEEAGVALSVSLEGELSPCFFGNQNKVKQILESFLVYSMKNTKPGGSVSLIGYEEARHGKQSRLCFIITDTGDGIHREDQEKLFIPFGQGTDAGGKIALNTGLGLSVAYNLISSMNGDVSVKCEGDKGNVFTIRIMLDQYENDDHETAAKASGDAKEVSLTGVKVIVAEDNALNRTILEAMLTNEGIAYTEAINGREAVDAFVAEPDGTFSCILMDMRMPGMDGVRAAEAIRASGKADGKTIPIIGVSANGFADDVKKAREAGFNEYITKPINRGELFAAMRKLIKRE